MVHGLQILLAMMEDLEGGHKLTMTEHEVVGMLYLVPFYPLHLSFLQHSKDMQILVEMVDIEHLVLLCQLVEEVELDYLVNLVLCQVQLTEVMESKSILMEIITIGVVEEEVVFSA